MKKLLFNIALIVGSSLLFIQCAKLFPIETKIHLDQSPVTSSANNISKNKNHKAKAAVTALNMDSVFKNKALIPVFSNSILLYNMMTKINDHSIFYSSIYQF